MIDYQPPFPWFGGKTKAAAEVWRRFGNVSNYVEPFAGSMATLFRRPHKEIGTETVNDRDCYVANFFRSLRNAPDKVTEYADRPVNEADLHAIHLWLLKQADFRQRVLSDPDFYDPKVAGWWVWGVNQWIGSGWCNQRFYDGKPSQQLIHLGDPGTGVSRPQLRDRANLLDYMTRLSERLRRVRVACGDWRRVTGPSVTYRHGITGVLLDPPYAADLRRKNLYGVDPGVDLVARLMVRSGYNENLSGQVRKWAIISGQNPLMRIAVCGYENEHRFPPEWQVYRRKANGGYGNQGEGRGRENSARECIWFSPHCLKADAALDV